MDLVGAAAIRGRQHDLGAPDNLPVRVTLGTQSFQLRTVDGAKAKADVIAS